MTGATHAWPVLFACGCLVLASGCTSLNVLERQATTPVLIGPDGVATPPAPVPMTLPRFLGIDTIGRRCIRKTVLLGQITYEKAATAVPALQPPPMSLPSSHPANAASPSPAVAGALKAKEAKVATAAKVKALGVLAGEDCSVNPHVKKAFLQDWTMFRQTSASRRSKRSSLRGVDAIPVAEDVAASPSVKN